MGNDFKATLNLPKTSFPMRASLATREPERLAFWRKQGLYARMREVRSGDSRWVLHDGPPYANGHIHLGTALNKILKDVVVRFRALEGHDAPYVPGWDCHGMPIEHRVVKEMGDAARDADPVTIRKACREYAEKYLEVQREEFQRLGCIGDWDNPYHSMTPHYEATILRAVRELAEKGYLYRGLRPIHWCASCRTALAEAEVEYEEHKSPAVTVKFALEGDWKQGRPELETLGSAYILIWTTTPWTLPANLAVAVHPEFDYAWYEVGEEAWLMADRLAPLVLETAGVDGHRMRTESGATLTDLLYTSPLNERSCPVLTAEHVTLDQGTGCVHTAPGHGHEDFELGRHAGLEILNPVAPDGTFTDEAGRWKGLHVHEANGPIAESLEQAGLLVHKETVEHSYPHCWRCHNPVLFRATEQWFLNVDHESLRDRSLEAIDHKRWVPSWGHDRIHNMVELRPDWCLSRQRSWGVPIPAFRCRSCDQEILEPEWIRYLEGIVEKEGSDAWFERKPEELRPTGASCPECAGTDLEPQKDILDVWFDASCSHLAVLEGNEDLAWPAQLYLEAGDQHRGWFQVSLLNGMALRDQAPFESVLTHGLILDENGKKMSKSLGNVIAPEKILKQYGADILRLAYTSVDFTADIPFSQERNLDPAAESYRRIRNTCRFLLGNLEDFDPATDAVEYEEMPPLERFALATLRAVAGECLAAYRDYAFHRVVRRLVHYCATDLSAFYLDIRKDRLYCESREGSARRSVQTVLHQQLSWVMRLLLPILPFTMEEAWEFARKEQEEPEFAQLSRFPAPEALPEQDKASAEDWGRLLEVRDRVLAALEEARNAKELGQSLEAAVTLRAGAEVLRALGDYPDSLADLFIVSQVDLKNEPLPDPDGLEVAVARAPGEKCPRCWKYTGQDDPEAPCERCARIVEAGS